MPIKLEFSASVGFIHKESLAMHGKTILKKRTVFYFSETICLSLDPSKTQHFTCVLSHCDQSLTESVHT